MKLKPIIVVLAAVALTGCAATWGQWVTVKQVPLEAEVTGERDLSQFAKARVMCVAKEKRVTVDGDLGEWKDADWMTLNREEQFPGEGWNGVDDLSGRLALAHDADNLYVAAEVTDDVIVWEYTGAEIWSGDSIQISIDPWLTRKQGIYTEEVVEFGFSGKEGESGVQTWRWACGRPPGPGALPAEAALAQPSEGVVRYELAIPLEELGSWRPGLVVKSGGSWLINDNDGAGRKGYLEWTPGIGASKDPSSFGVLDFDLCPEVEKPSAMVARFYWGQPVAAQGRPLEVHLRTILQGEGLVAKVTVRLDPDAGGRIAELSLPLEPGRQAYAVALETDRIPVGRHKVVIELDDGSGYTASTAHSIYIYPPARY